MIISRKLSDSFTIGSFICTLLVVSIHFNTKDHIAPTDLGGFNYYFQEFFTNAIARVAVPYFSIISGFFFFQKYHGLKDYKNNITKRFRTILIPYVVSSLLIFLSEHIYLVVTLKEPALPQLLTSLRTIFLKPLPVQHWFLRDLIFLSLIAPLIYFLKQRLWPVFLFLLLLLWAFDIEFMPKLANRYIIAIETLTFFVIGSILSSYADEFESHLKCQTRSIIVLLSFCYLCLVAWRVLYVAPDFMNYYTNHYDTCSLILQNSTKILGIYLSFTIFYRIHSKNLIALSSFSFFIYIFHGLPLNRIINKVSDFFMPDAYKFYVNFPISIATTIMLAYALRLISPKIYKILSGGRGSRKQNIQ